ESVVLFWGSYKVLWAIIAALIVVDLMLIRMGIQTFSREEILAREVDEFDMRRIGRRFVAEFLVEGKFSPRALILNLEHKGSRPSRVLRKRKPSKVFAL